MTLGVSGRKFQIAICPDCGGHLGDTWDEDAGECQNCGFAYVHVRPEDVTARDAVAPPALGVVGFAMAMLAGLVLAESTFVSEAGTGAVAIGTPDGAFIAALALGLVALSVIASATTWGGSR